MDATFQAQSITTATTSAFAIDLSDFGYAENAVMPAGTHIIFSDGQGVDPSEIYALPIDAVRGDFNYDGVVDSRDYTLWRDRYGQGYSMADLANLQANYRRTLTSVGSTSYVVAVPAPATSMLGLLACFTTVVSSAYRDVK